jgi:hypothetical protein
MSEPLVLKKENGCPECGGPFFKVRQPSDEERAAAARQGELHVPLKPLGDTAPLATVKELGPLYRCTSCGLSVRFGPE